MTAKSKAICAVAMMMVGLSNPAVAGPVPKTGWPFCADRDELKEFFMAMLKKDASWMKSLKTCIMAKPGLNMVTIEDFESDSEIGHVAKVRLIGESSRNSIVGYTLKLKDGPDF